VASCCPSRYFTATSWKYHPLLPRLGYLNPRALYHLMPMPAEHTSTPRGKKREQSPEIDQSEDAAPSSAPYWRKGGFRSAEEANTAFWDNLSKVPLCRAALKELDRRNSSTESPPSQPAVWADLPRSHQDRLELRRSAARLKRFARRGGPDLDGLRGICWLL
jgi:hypothetical protein